ncbi:MAG: ComEC/Rec2 family competence protein [Aestuariivirga sp.]
MTTSHADSTFIAGFKVSVQGPLTGTVARRQSLVQRLWADVEAQGGLVLWVPLLLLTGNWAYFQSRFEPALWPVIGLGGLTLLLFWLGRRFRMALVIALVLSGFVLAKLRQEYVQTPLLASAISQSDISGIVADVESRDRQRIVMLVEVQSATHIPDGQVPRRLRVSAFSKAKILIGDTVSFSASLLPLPRPVNPGGFDYGRMLYFWSVGGTAQVKGEVTIHDEPVSWRYELRRQFHGLRSSMGERITRAIPGPLGAFANALITGERAAIPDSMNLSLQISGLYHILSISGLHMSLVAGGVFFTVRAVLALFPGLALRRPIKKYAAGAALFVGLIYMLLADFGAATERSYIMIAVMFFAILVDRPAISLRNLAISAIIILVVTPEESTGASFQMSFLAVMALVAFFEWWKSRQVDVKAFDQASWIRFVKLMWTWVAVSVLTTLVAGSASSIAAVYHFGRASPYGVVANALALPITEFLVMPEALAAALLMPFGLEGWALDVMHFGLWLTMLVSDEIASWPGANLMLAQPSLIGTCVTSLGLYVACMAARSVKLVGVVAMVAGLFLASLGERPQILVEERAGNVAIRDDGGDLVLANAAGGKFAAIKWLNGNGESVSLSQAADRPGWSCLEDSCFAEVKGLQLGYLRKQESLTHCPPVDIVIADFPLRGACADAKLRIDRFDVWRNGAHAVFIDDVGAVTVKSVREEQGDRPWVFSPRKAIKVVVP